MSYLVKIENNAEGKGLVNFLKTLNYVKVIEYEHSNISNQTKSGLFDINGNSISVEEFNSIIDLAEQTDDVPLITAITASEKWKDLKN
ncbi:MAG: hypothetical protein RO257_12895 [Candidatus Kapabacteria bacterium]|nr:hypothetical protein [Candidatus Kapabacteria bacterium]